MVLRFRPPARHQYRLTPVTEAPIVGRLEDGFQLFLFRCRQPNPPHLFSSPLMRNLTRGYRKKDAKSSGVCIRLDKRIKLKDQDLKISQFSYAHC
jgi:hypothetical protein